MEVMFDTQTAELALPSIREAVVLAVASGTWIGQTLTD